MSDYNEVRQFLKENSVSDEQMNIIWLFMYDKNRVVKALSDHGKNWTELNPLARKNLIKLYVEEGFL